MTIIKLIQEIAKYHPASEAGKKRGWSQYVGGMADTGSWDAFKMMDATIEELQKCLNELIEEWKPRSQRVYTEEEKDDMNKWVKTPNGAITVHQLKLLNTLHENFESRLIWGK